VLRQANSQWFGVRQGSTHERRILHTDAIVREEPNTESGHFGDGREHLAAATLRNSTRHGDIEWSARSSVEHVGHQRDVVERGLSIGHRHERGETSESAREGPAFNGLGLFTTGLAQMRVQINETWSHPAAGRVYFGCATRHVAEISHTNNLTINNQNITNLE
jgi:hypothetical protein